MIDDHWPFFGLEVSTPSLRLRVPREEELAALADLAAGGVHPPDERPFLTPWAEGTPEERARYVLLEHWDRLASWSPTDWRLGLGIFTADGEALGAIRLAARDFSVIREVTTYTWLGLAHQGRGLGTEARRGVLSLAFDHLAAASALTFVFRDNHASQGVSRRLGYRPDGTTRDARGDEMLVSDRLRLDAADWAGAREAGYSVTGLDACRGLLGAT
ncbi:GNAT family N-acetyltransferase [Nocardioides sp. AX2bis]|uniref:GNAT family N-acetyltransferase n=1 Tax=Nocardioides sp. AX2bis TaxID=2653157 RepID=UPI0012EFE881|nr:GNAT family protein [Nocardioides sp. AX2bis]VXB57252.1 Protein N-acetyltransferase, RimJ/RimL family [Nocardioides sp. AX2bis]